MLVREEFLILELSHVFIVTGLSSPYPLLNFTYMGYFCVYCNAQVQCYLHLPKDNPVKILAV